jgi:hypothetical protein
LDGASGSVSRAAPDGGVRRCDASCSPRAFGLPTRLWHGRKPDQGWWWSLPSFPMPPARSDLGTKRKITADAVGQGRLPILPGLSSSFQSCGFLTEKGERSCHISIAARPVILGSPPAYPIQTSWCGHPLPECFGPAIRCSTRTAPAVESCQDAAVLMIPPRLNWTATKTGLSPRVSASLPWALSAVPV